MPRHRDERLALRFPGLYRRLARRVMALPPGSLLRRRALKRMVSRGFESFSRGDIEVALLIAHPDVEMRNIGWEALGLSARPILRTKATARGKRSGAGAVLGVCYCYYFADGQITRWERRPELVRSRRSAGA